MSEIVDLRLQIYSKYGKPYEYLLDNYPVNYFDYYIDIGARGEGNPWHINHLGKNNPNTTCVGYEPDIPYYEQLVNLCSEFDNVKMYKEGVGDGSSIGIPGGSCDTVTLPQIISDNEIDIDSNWSIKIDCEGCEYQVFNDIESINILRKASHISLEAHKNDAGGNYFIDNNNLPTSFDNIEMLLVTNFYKTHSIFVTSTTRGLTTYLLLSNEIISKKDDLFWKDIL